jgi:hypothetical protein
VGDSTVAQCPKDRDVLRYRHAAAEGGLGIPRVERLDETLHELKVLLRHRLPLQAHCFASLLVVEEVLDQDDEALAECDDSRNL